MSRKYRQSGYQNSSDQNRETRKPAPKGRFSREGPRSPVMPGYRQAMRCALCGATLPPDTQEITFDSKCPSCQADLHSCKNCVFLDPASRFECTQQIKERVSKKDEGNACTFFEARTTVEKETSSGSPDSRSSRMVDPREAFERLFKK